MDNVHFPEGFPDYRALALYELAQEFAPNLPEPCEAFFIPYADKDQVSVYQQVVWPYDKNRKCDLNEQPIVQYAHVIVNKSKSAQTEQMLTQKHGSVRVIGMTRAFGYTMGVHHLSAKDKNNLHQKVSVITPDNKPIVHQFMANSFDTRQKGSQFVKGMRDHKHVWNERKIPLCDEWDYINRCLMSRRGYRELKHNYFGWFNDAPLDVRSEVTDYMVKSFTDVFENQQTKKQCDAQYDLFLKNGMDTTEGYQASIMKTKCVNRLLQDVAY